METLFAIVIGVLFAASIFLILRRNLFRLLMGLVLMSQAVNLLIFTCGGLSRGKPPVIEGTAKYLSGIYADPLPQALILTAIVISFGVLAFSLVLIFKAYRVIDVNDVDQMTEEIS